ncbi:serine/threonine-protein kinase, partial [Saccharomonospora saliphila]|uniref:serine/threonine-protein kinase n=1 Tax=Saccharomonospora saliphila TaxID=369829 RepID=UPI0012FC11B3
MSEVGALLAGRYRLRRHLGSGAMGVVWLADDERLQRPVAVKQLLQQGAAGTAAQARERVMREGRIAARLHHPNAVAVHDVAEHDGFPLLVMEYFPATSLAETLATATALPVASAARIGTQVSAALAAAHGVGIVHRDVKPANVLLGADGTAKIVDFGIAHAGGDVTLTQTGLVAGTPAFLAPEVARGADPSPASDVFSLGALLYTTVQGSPPFGDGDGNPLALLHRVAAATIPPPDRAGALTPVLSAVLATDPGSARTPGRSATPPAPWPRGGDHRCSRPPRPTGT